MPSGANFLPGTEGGGKKAKSTTEIKRGYDPKGPRAPTGREAAARKVGGNLVMELLFARVTGIKQFGVAGAKTDEMAEAGTPADLLVEAASAM